MIEKKHCKLCDNPRFANTGWCLEHYKEREKQRAIKKKDKVSKTKKVKKKTNQQIKKTIHNRVWKLMSKYIRLKYADKQGKCKCYTCDTVKDWKELQAGHFKHDRLDFDERNLKPQCVKCNHFHSGRLDVYAENLIKDYGLKWFNKLVKDSWSHMGYSIEDMLKKEQELKNELEKYDIKKNR